MSNFDFIPDDFRGVKEPAIKAESYIVSDPRSACFNTRLALELAVHWLYRHDNSFRVPYDRNLAALIHEPTFKNNIPQAVFQKIKVIQKVGNEAVHENRTIREFDAIQTVKELHHVLHWMIHVYKPELRSKTIPWNQSLVPKPVSEKDAVPRKKLEELEARLAKQNEAELKRLQEKDKLDEEIQKLKIELERIRAASEKRLILTITANRKPADIL